MSKKKKNKKKCNLNFIKKLKSTGDCRFNGIILIVLSILLLVSLLTNGFWMKNSVINQLFAKRVANKTIDYINKNFLPEGIKANLVSVKTKSNGLYELKFKINQQEYTSYVTSDGKMLFPEGILLSESNKKTSSTKEEIPKKDKADAKLFVMSYCPYGNQAEELMKPVYDLLKNDANIEVHYIVSREGDKYTSLHGDQELNQDIREICVKKYQPDKFWDFVLAANEKATYQDIDSKWEEIAKSVGVEVTKVKECQEKEYKSLLDAEIALAEKYGASGSPTLVINDVTYSGDRTASAYKDAICSGFKTQPKSCSQKITEPSNSNASGSCN